MRVRFAPSPTGYLHVGNARTAIINYLIARKNNAKFILRVEDTDMERSSKESEKSIMDDLHWLGLEWDEGPDKEGDFGPYRQSERFDIYKKYTDKLINEEKAYYCYCTQDELEEMKKKTDSGEQQFTYSGKCRNLSDDERKKLESDGRKPTVRFSVPANESITVKDYIRGNVIFNSENIGGDFIIVRSDGVPIYNYIVVIDDTLMEISHVIRGDDHLSNTPKQILIARALDLPIPEYAHHPLILGEDRSKLSKRHGITSVSLYRKEGYLPEAIVNYLTMLGWAAETGEEIFSYDDLIKQIDINSLAKSAAVFDFQKLKWMNGIHIRNYPIDKIIELFLPHIEEAGYSTSQIDSNLLKDLISLLRGYCDVLPDISNLIGIFLDDAPEPDEDSDKLLQEDYSKEVIKAADELMKNELNEENFSTSLINSVKQKTSLKGKQLFMPVRAIITGRLKGPEMDKAMPLIGFEKCKKRIKFCLDKYC